MSKSEENFCICFYKNDEGIIGHEVSFDGVFKGLDGEKAKKRIDGADYKTKEEDTEVNSEESNEKTSPFDEIFIQFKDSMLGYMEVLPVLSGFVPSLSHISRAKAIIDFAKRNGSESTSTPSSEIFTVRRDKIIEFFQLNSRHDAALMVGKQIPKMMIIGVVSSYEHHYSLILREVFKKNPEKLESTKKTFTAKDLFEASSIEDFKETLLEREVDSLLRENFSDQITWLEKNIPLASNISKEHDGWGELVEIFERRNLFAHANGIVNSQYINKTKMLNLKHTPVKGKELVAGRKYLSQSIESICEFGIKIIQVVWRKLQKGDEELASQRLGDFGYELINRGRYRLAVKILEFARQLSDRSGVNENRKRMDLVNLANSYRLVGESKRCLDLIDSVDWTIVSNDFKVSIHAVKDEINEVLGMMPKLAASGEFDAKNFEEWPVFIKLRENSDFKQKFEEIFERPYVPSEKYNGGLFSILSLDEDVEKEKSPKEASST